MAVQVFKITEMMGMPPDYMLERGRKTASYFRRERKDAPWSRIPAKKVDSLSMMCRHLSIYVFLFLFLFLSHLCLCLSFSPSLDHRPYPRESVYLRLSASPPPLSVCLLGLKLALDCVSLDAPVGHWFSNAWMAPPHPEY